MKTRNSAKLVVVSVLLAGANTGNACEIERDFVTGMWRGNCNLTIDPKAPKVEVPYIDAKTGRIHIRMPDLLIDKFKYSLVGNDLEVYVDVVNEGLQSSFATEVGLTIIVRDPSDHRVVSTVRPVRPVPALAAGARQRIYMTTVYPNASAQDWEVVTTGMVDLTTVAQPVRGLVIESNETNNGLVHLCIVYGPNPTVSSLPLCN